jgi:hypothetical protein
MRSKAIKASEQGMQRQQAGYKCKQAVSQKIKVAKMFGKLT